MMIYLPPDILREHLFPYLSNDDLCSLLQTHHSFYSVGLTWGVTKRRIAIKRLLPHPDPTMLFIRMINALKKKTCICCMEKTTRVHPIYKVNMCRECTIREHPMICKSAVMTKYHLKENEFSRLTSVSVRNPYHRHNPDMTLYLERDVRDVYDRYKDVVDARISLKEQHAQRKQDLRTKRRESLENALKKKGLIVREDSELCALYISGRRKIESDEGAVSLTLKFIVHEMCIMKYLFEYTDFQEQVENEIENIADDYGYYPRGVRKMAHTIVKHRTPLPSTFPWMTD